VWQKQPTNIKYISIFLYGNNKIEILLSHKGKSISNKAKQSKAKQSKAKQ